MGFYQGFTYRGGSSVVVGWTGELPYLQKRSSGGRLDKRATHHSGSNDAGGLSRQTNTTCRQHAAYIAFSLNAPLLMTFTW